MSMPVPDEHSIESFRRFYEFLPRHEDQSLVLLKIHLLVEQQIRAFVDERLPNPDALASARLTFNHVACLAEAISREDIHPNVWSAVRKLNQMRNDIAHKLVPTRVEQQLREFCALVGAPARPEAKGADLLSDFGFSAMALHNEIALFVKRRPAQVVQLVSNAENAP